MQGDIDSLVFHSGVRTGDLLARWSRWDGHYGPMGLYLGWMVKASDGLPIHYALVEGRVVVVSAHHDDIEVMGRYEESVG